MKNIIYAVVILTFCSCQKDVHQEPTHNFTVKRLIVLNDQNEILMGKEAGNWYTLSHVYTKRQSINECMDSLTNRFGIETTPPELRGYFGYKYEYHPHSTLRAFYVAKHISGEPKAVSPVEEFKWMPLEEAIRKTPVESMKMITQQILENPNTVWGGSFMVFRDGEEHRARMIEDFYPLFQSK